MRTHEGKTQFFCRAADCSDTAQVLGVTLGQSNRPLSAKELRRRKQAEYVAQRIGLLPVTLKFRATLAAVVYSPKASWRRKLQESYEAGLGPLFGNLSQGRQGCGS